MPALMKPASDSRHSDENERNVFFSREQKRLSCLLQTQLTTLCNERSCATRLQNFVERCTQVSHSVVSLSIDEVPVIEQPAGLRLLGNVLPDLSGSTLLTSNFSFNRDWQVSVLRLISRAIRWSSVGDGCDRGDTKKLPRLCRISSRSTKGERIVA